MNSPKHQRPRIVVLAENFFDGKGGGDSRIRRIVRWLREKGLDVRVVALRPPDGTYFVPEDFFLYDLPTVKLHGSLQWLFATPLTYYKTRKALLGLNCWNDADIVWTIMERGSSIARSIAPNSTILYSPGEVYPGLRDYFGTQGLGRGRMAPLKQAIDWFWHRRMQRHAIDAASGIVAHSQNTAGQLKREYPCTKPILVSHNPAPSLSTLSSEERAAVRKDIRRELAIPESAHVFVSAGRLTKRKGFDLLIKAFACLGGTEAHLIVCGQGPLTHPLNELARSLDVSHRVHFVGHVSPVSSHFFAADCFVSASFFEPFGNVFLEAMAAGLPVIGLTGPNDGVRTACLEIIRSEDYGHVILGKNIQALADKMLRMINLDENELAAMQNAATEAANTTFSPEIVLGEQFAFALRLLEAKPVSDRGQN